MSDTDNKTETPVAASAPATTPATTAAAAAEASTKSDDTSKPKLETTSILNEDFVDDDDDDDDEDEERERKSTTAPVLRGLLKAKDNSLVWMGKWAMSADQYKAGDKAKFKYTYAGSKDVKSACDGDGKVTKPLSGKYNGYFCLNNSDPEKSPTKVKENGVQLTFTAKPQGNTFEVSGKGSNKYGDFSLSGVYEPASARLAIIKAYVVDEYDDSDDDGDDDIDDVDEVDASEVAEELATLKADNELSVDELRAKYAAAAAASSGEPKAKRSKTAE